jgi:hypothetical protein
MSFWRGHRWFKWVAGGVLAALAVIGVLAAIALHRAEPFLRAQIVQALEERFKARVELDSFHVSLVHGLSAQGSGLRIWPPARMAGDAAEATTGQNEPLIRLAEFRFRAPLHYRPGAPIHISDVHLKGLDIDVPPRAPSKPPAGAKAQGAADRPAEASATEMAAPVSNVEEGSKSLTGNLTFVVDTMECTGANLVMETSKPGKLPLQFVIATLKMQNMTSSEAMKFQAELTNPRPVGTIHTTGSFGPWAVDDPGASAVSGDYRFEHADLATFKGIAGILSSTGKYSGTLRDIVVDGETDTPDFKLTPFDSPMPLHTHFHAKVDGTNGDTWLEPVDATLGHSHFTAQGQVVRVTAEENGALRETGRDVALNIDVDQARIEDFLHLASKADTQLLTGDVKVKADLHIPPGPTSVMERMTLNGHFQLDQARFSNAKIQDRIEELSLRGLGRPKDVKSADPASVRSAMQGSFQMAGGTIHLPDLDYAVPGAEIQLQGAYGIEGGTLDFTGIAKLQATVSQIVGGWKGLLLKPADRFFKKDGAGTEVPIYVKGTRAAPEFGIDLTRMKTTHPERPGAEPQ